MWNGRSWELYEGLIPKVVSSHRAIPLYLNIAIVCELTRLPLLFSAQSYFRQTENIPTHLGSVSPHISVLYTVCVLKGTQAI